MVKNINQKTGKIKISSRGGARPGAGRPKGSSDKVTARHLLEQAETVIGKDFVTSLLEGYRETIINSDTRNRVVYEKMILDKVSSTLLETEVTESDDVVETKKIAFAEAIAAIIENTK
tara:strand:- start:7708 stop:8061 length:354 start_codon:yes stop_codon:yes gene_type:complete